MKSMLFGLALLCALPGCCGMWKCDKDEEGNGKRDKKEMREDKRSRKDVKDMKDKNYKK